MPKQDNEAAMNAAKAFILENLSKSVREILDWHSTAILQADGVIREDSSKLQGVFPNWHVFNVVEGFISEMTMKEYLRLSE